MKHNLLWRLMALFTVLLASGEHAKALPPGIDHIYLVDFSNGSNWTPEEKNEEFFSKLFLTSPGVFEGDVTFERIYNNGGIHYFRFFSQLQDNYNYDWSINNISPIGESYLSQIGESGILKASDVYDMTVLPSGMDTGSWVLSRPGNYHITVDMNKGTMDLMPIDDVFIIFGNPVAPSEDEYADQCALTNFYDYIEPGNISMCFYSPYKKSWMKASLKEGGWREGTNDLAFESCSSPTPLKIERWPGGLVEGGPGQIYLTPDDILKGNISADTLFYVGDVNDWVTSDYRDDRYECKKLDESGKLFDVFIPRGTSYFKIIGPKGWLDFINLGSGETVWKNEKGEFVIQLHNSLNSASIAFDSPIYDDLHGILDLEELTLTLPADAPLSEREKNVTAPDYTERMYVCFPKSKEVEIYKGASHTVHDRYKYLEKVDENTWKGKIFLEDNFYFIYELTPKGQPNVCIGPALGKDVTLVSNDGYAYASGSPSVSPHCWLPSEVGGKYAVVTVTKEGDGFKVVIDCEGAVQNPDKIYLIGLPQGWNIGEGNMPLRLTDKGGYYGEFNIYPDQAMFRFYTHLDDWERNSLGTQYDDNPLEYEMTDGSFHGNFVYGKGSWSFPDWPGGKMYIYVDLNAMTVDFSDSPIENVGNILEEQTRQPYAEGVFATNSDDEAAEPLTEIAPGVYHYISYVNERQPGMMRFFSRRLPISTDEPEWIGSYTISVEGDGFVDFREKHYAEFDIVLNNEIGTEAATPLRWKVRNPHDATLLDIVVDLNEKKLYVADFGYIVLVHAGEPAPDARTAPAYADRIIWNYSGGIVDIPAGEFDVWLYTNVWPDEPSQKQTVSLKDDPFQVWSSQMFSSWWLRGAVAVPDWHGGKVFFDPCTIFDLSSLETVKVSSYNGEGYDTGLLTQTAPGSKVFKGSVKLTMSENAGYSAIKYIDLLLAEKTLRAKDGSNEEYDRYFCVNAGCAYPYHPYLSIPTNDERSIYLRENETAKSNVELGTLSFLLPNLSGEAKLDITLDLNDMTVETRLVEGSASTAFEVVAGEDSKLDGLKSANVADGNIMVETKPFTDGEDLSSEYNFNFLTDHDSIIVPEGGKSLTIEFDERGVWTGKFTEISADIPANAPSRRLAARKAARESATWNFEMPKDDSHYIQMLIDEKKKSLTVFSMTHNNCFFIEQGRKNLYLVDLKYTTLADVLSGKAEILAPTEAEKGVWKGSFDIYEDAVPDFITFKNSVSGYWSPYYGIHQIGGFSSEGKDVFDFSSGHDSATQYAVDKFKRNPEGDMMRYYPTEWQLIDAKPGNYEAIYDSKQGTLTITRKSDTPGMVTSPESVASTLQILPGRGEVTVIAAESARIDFYSVSGMLVRSLNVSEGATVVRIPTGLYIVNGKKIGVR